MSKASRRARPEAPDTGKRSIAIALLVFLAALAWLWAPAIDTPFVYDDHRVVVENPSLASGNLYAMILFERFRPVTNLSYGLDHARGGLDPKTYHQSNLALHLLAAALLLVLLWGWSADAGREPGPIIWLGVAIATAHPLQVETVAYATGRSELLTACGALACLIAYRRWSQSGSSGWLIGSVIAFVFSLASKEVAAGVPLLLLAWDSWLGGAGAGRRRRTVLFPWIALVGVAGVARLTLWARTAEGGLEAWWTHLQIVGRTLWRYLALLGWPSQLSLVHEVRSPEGLDILGVIGLLAFAGAGLAAAIWGRRAPLIGLGVLAWLLALAPSHVIPLAEAMAEHRAYLGVLLLPSLLLIDLHRRWPRAVPIAAAGGILALSMATRERLEIWQDPVTLWGAAVEVAPQTWAARYGLGFALAREGDCESAIVEFQIAGELLPDRPEAGIEESICLGKLGQLDAAAMRLEGMTETAMVLNNLATVRLLQGQPRKALQLLDRSLDRDPKNVHALKLSIMIHQRAISASDRVEDLCGRLKNLDPKTWRQSCTSGPTAPTSR